MSIYTYPHHILASLQPLTCKGPSQQIALCCGCISVSVLGFGRINSCLIREMDPFSLGLFYAKACLRASVSVIIILS